MKIKENRSLFPILFGILAIGIIGSVQSASAISIDFNVFQTGLIIDTELQGSNGVTVSASNVGGGPDFAVIFDSTSATGGDDDLEGPPTDNWDGGNLANPVQVGLQKILILEEKDFDVAGNGPSDPDPNGIVGDDPNQAAPISPDDEGSQPSGSIFIKFDDCVESFGFDMVDVEPPNEVSMGTGYVAFFVGDPTVPANEIARVQFENLDAGSPGLFADPSVNFGNDYANRINTFTTAELSAHTGNTITGFTGIEFNIGGSGGFDNLEYEHCVVGGSGFEIDKTALLVAGAQANSSWIIPIIVSAIVIGIFSKKKVILRL